MFAARLLKGRGGIIYEDGEQTRDFTHVSDIVQALMLAGIDEKPYQVRGEVFNVGTGVPTSLLTLHSLLAQALGVPDIQPVVTGEVRKGDVQHCFANIDRARKHLGYAPVMRLREGLSWYAHWLRRQDLTAINERVEYAAKELRERGLLFA
jgi:dTDP-L-rhamnose 4-epimerase